MDSVRCGVILMCTFIIVFAANQVSLSLLSH